jgi:hypothetical protein
MKMYQQHELQKTKKVTEIEEGLIFVGSAHETPNPKGSKCWAFVKITLTPKIYD